MLIDVDLSRDVALSETYAVAFHRYTDPDGYPTDMWAGLRYVDRFERRDGQWRIRRRVCAYEWRRTDRVGGEGGFADTYRRGAHRPTTSSTTSSTTSRRSAESAAGRSGTAVMSPRCPLVWFRDADRFGWAFWRRSAPEWNEMRGTER